ncbi:MAG: polysaccharide biosynthesis/export family protein, partial [Armatimonadota bacterium]
MRLGKRARLAPGIALALGLSVAVPPTFSGRAFAAPVQAQVHKLAPGDTVSIAVLGHAEFSVASAKVQTDGTIAYFFGAIPVSGATLAEVEKLVAGILVKQKQLAKPVVSVGLVAREARLAN